MRLHNLTLLYLSVALLAVLSIWAGAFYVEMLDKVYDSLDDGLINSKVLIIQKALKDESILTKTEFGESNYAIRPIPDRAAVSGEDIFTDTLIYSQNESDYEPARMLKTILEMPDGNHYELRIITSMVEEDDLIEDLLVSLIWLYLAMLASIIIINNLLLKRIWRPFHQLLKGLNQFRLGKDTQFDPPATTVKEFVMLNETTRALLNANIKAYNSQKEFIGNAAHELQTPLAISLNKLELLAERSNLSEESMNEIDQVMQILQRMTKLNKTLLLISRIENRQFATEENVDFNAIVAHLIEEFSDIAAFRQVQLSFHPEDALAYSMNKNLAEIMLTNFIKNAIVHNIPKGKIWITIQKNSIVFENTGIDAPLSEHKIFDRFYKSSTAQNATGLGLSLVKEIAGLYRLKVNYSFNKHHRFTILFPA